MSNWAEELENDLNWREAELASFKLMVSYALKGSVREQALLRALWTLLYAHYEGFCKFSWDLFLDALQEQTVQRSLCNDQIARFSLEKDFKKLKGNLSPTSIWSFCIFEFPRLMAEYAVFDIKLETQNNLWPNIFKDNAQKISLPTEIIDEHSTRIKTLVARRNEIAHGQKMIIKDLIEYQRYEDSALLVMHDLAINIIDCLENNKHIR
jgi:hypothetical protein